MYEDGELRHAYDSYSGYFDEMEADEDENPVGVADDEDFAYPAPVGVDPEAFLPLAAGWSREALRVFGEAGFSPLPGG